MSGVEAISFLLAVLPLFISAAEHYRDGYGAIRRVWEKEKILNEYIRDLGQQVTYLDLYLRKLVGSTDLPASVQERLIAKPAGEEWQSSEVHKALKEKLDVAYDPFMAVLDRLTTVLLNQVKKDDTLHSGNKSQLQKLEALHLSHTHADGIVKEKKQVLWDRIKFSWKENSRNRILLEIKGCNDHLLKLSTAAQEAQPYRRKQSSRRVHAAYECRREAWRLFQALSKSCQCTCEFPHDAKLRMQRITEDIDSAGEMKFDMVLYQCATAQCEVSVKMRTNLDSHLKKTKVQFQTTANSMDLVDQIVDQEALGDMCHAMKIAYQHDSCLEIYIDQDEKVWKLNFASPQSTAFRSYQLRSLQDLLLRSARMAHKRWLNREKAILAVVLAHSLLQLHESPWLPREWNTKHILFLDDMEPTGSGILPPDQFRLRRPYVHSSFTSNPGTLERPPSYQEKPQRVSGHRNPGLLALGVALLDIYLNHSIEQDAQDLGTSDLRMVAMDLLEDNADNETMTAEYYSAVKFCLCPSPDPLTRRFSFDDSGFRELYHTEVILTLEENLRSKSATDEHIWDQE